MATVDQSDDPVDHSSYQRQQTEDTRKIVSIEDRGQTDRGTAFPLPYALARCWGLALAE